MNANDDSAAARWMKVCYLTATYFDAAQLSLGTGIQEFDLNSLQPFRPRPVLALSHIERNGWYLKRYAILADGKKFDEAIATAASEEALRRLPKAGSLNNEAGNQGVAFQIVHFAEVGVVSPVFYWQWGSVLAHLDQMRASWDTPTEFKDGVKEVVGCIWEMNIVQFEVGAWANQLLCGTKSTTDGLTAYLQEHALPG
ncbi:hypothetical protein [Halovulum sp. GXIMD14793]